ncbi:hypothetical protein HPT29_021455 [Microvirga terrae]|uniref:Uncharacterized protein n=2 Tax=Microvirga terrae TaxID=2740529 RepID=A0ABY5S0I1_9HYPH|nr:hypothetical protein [Microvirga terrae]UVF22069.1 hypothetical protein HPT29_021455 [Microvirga terrae]
MYLVASDKRIKAGGLFPSEAEIARRLSQEPAEWAAKAKVLERDGLPPIDPMMGGRHWPSVMAYFNRRYGLSSIEPLQPDGEENLNAI